MKDPRIKPDSVVQIVWSQSMYRFHFGVVEEIDLIGMYVVRLLRPPGVSTIRYTDRNMLKYLASNLNEMSEIEKMLYGI